MASSIFNPQFAVKLSGYFPDMFFNPDFSEMFRNVPEKIEDARERQSFPQHLQSSIPVVRMFSDFFRKLSGSFLFLGTS